MFRKIVFLVVFSSTVLVAQQKNSWQMGIGTSLVKFGEQDAQFIGDKHIFQIPRLNFTIPVSENWSVDGALSFNTFNDAGIVENKAYYFSADASLRYHFDEVVDKVFPYVFTGGSIVDSERKKTPTLNVGAGAVYWFAEKWGLNPQIYYKHSFPGYESMRSHVQFTLGIVYDLRLEGLFRGTSKCYNR